MSSRLVGSVVLLLSAMAASAFGRVWTLQNGTTIEAQFHRLRDGELWLKSRGKIARIPLDQLSAGDAYWTTVWQQARQPRPWTRRWGDENLTGRFVRCSDGSVIIDTGAGQAAVDFALLAPADQKFIRAVLATRRRQDDVPAAVGRQKVQLPTTARPDHPRSDEPPAEAASGDADGDTPEARVWTTVAGDQMLGTFASTNTDRHGFGRVVIAGSDRDMEVYFHELSDTDQEFVQSELLGQNATNAACAKCSQTLAGFTPAEESSDRPSPHLASVADAPVRLGGFRATRGPIERPQVDMTPRNGRLGDSRQGDLQASGYLPERRPAKLGVIESPIPGLEAAATESDVGIDEPLDPADRERQVQAFFGTNEGARSAPVAADAGGSSLATIGRRPAVESKRTMLIESDEHSITCGNCGQTFSSATFEPGDACLHCGRAIHRVAYADGTVNHSSSYWKPFIHLTLIAIVVLAALMYTRMR